MTGEMRLRSPAFADGHPIPARYTGDGENVSPELRWSDAPPGTANLALTCEDPDAPGGTFTHWLVWDISPATVGISAGEVPRGARQGRERLRHRRLRRPVPSAGPWDPPLSLPSPRTLGARAATRWVDHRRAVRRHEWHNACHRRARWHLSALIPSDHGARRCRRSRGAPTSERRPPGRSRGVDPTLARRAPLSTDGDDRRAAAAVLRQPLPDHRGGFDVLPPAPRALGRTVGRGHRRDSRSTSRRFDS